MSTHPTSTSRCIFIAAFLATFSLTAFAQSLPDNKAADDENTNSEVVTLEEFTVSSASLKDSYIASESAAGTRIKEAIVDLPYSVQVFTEDMINDFQFFDRGNMNAHVAGSSFGTGGDTSMDGGADTLNGFGSGGGRDGFRIALPSNPANTVGSEVLSGAQGVFYGEVAFGGVINYKNRRPSQKPSYMLTLNVGTYDYKRASAYASGPLIQKKLYYLLTLDQQNMRFNGPWSDKTISTAGLSFLYSFNRNTFLTVGYEYSFTDQDEFRASANLIRIRQDGILEYTRYWEGAAHFNQFGPHSLDTRAQGGLNVLLEHRISSSWAARGAVQTWFSRNRIERDARPTLVIDEINGTSRFNTLSPTTTPGVSPYRDRGSDSNIGAQIDITGTFATGKVAHRLMAGIDYANRRVKTRVADMANAYIIRMPDSWVRLDFENPQWLPHERGVIDPTQPGPWDVVDYDLVNRYSSYRDYEYESIAALMSFRSYFFKNRLITNLSARIQRDEAHAWRQEFQNVDPLPDGSFPLGPVTEGDLVNSPFNYGFGFNYKIRDEKLVYYAVASSGFVPDRSGRVDRVTGEIIEPERAQSFDTGLKSSLLDGRLGWTLSLYQITRKDVADTNPDFESSDLANSPPQYIIGREDRTRGVKTYFVWLPLKSRALSIAADLAYADGIVVKDAPGSSPDLTGWRRRGVSKWKGSFTAVYQFKKGTLKGFKAGSSLAFRSNFLAQEPSSSTVTPYPAKWLPSLALVDAFVSYNFKTKSIRAASHTVQLNVANLTNKKYYGTNGRLSFGTTLNLTYKITL